MREIEAGLDSLFTRSYEFVFDLHETYLHSQYVGAIYCSVYMIGRVGVESEKGDIQRAPFFVPTLYTPGL